MWRTSVSTGSGVVGILTAVIVIAFVACSGGGGLNAPEPKSANQPETTASLTIPLRAIGLTVKLPAVGDFAETITLPANSNHAANLHLTISTNVSSAMPAMAAAMHVARPYIYITLSTSQNVTLDGFPGFSVTIPTADLGAPPVKLGYYDPTKGWQRIGDMVQSGNTWSFSGGSTPIALASNTVDYAVPYTCGGPSPSPSPSGSPTSASTTIPLAAPGTPMPIPAIGGFSGQFRVGKNNAPSHTKVTLTSYDTKPPGAPIPDSTTAHWFHRFTLRPPVGLWVAFAFSTSGSLGDPGSFTFQTFPATNWSLAPGTNTTGVTFFLETFDGTAGTLLAKESASSVTSKKVTFPAVPHAFTATFGHTYWWELISTPSVTEFTLPTGTGPGDITAGPDGNLWFGELNLRSNLGRISPIGKLKEFPLPNGTFARRITVGPDGNLWFTLDFGPGQVGRITTGGVMTIFALPTHGNPVGITTGADGNLWVADPPTGKLARVTTSGSITEFQTFTAADKPFGVVTGPDGNLWVTLSGANEVARVVILTQTVTRFPVPTPSSFPNYIISSGGSLYFEENFSNKIGISSTAGAITEKSLPFPVPTSYPGFITTGPDGNVWFADEGAGEIGTIESGAIVEFPLPNASSLPVGITKGPNNTIWFTENAADKIGTFTVAVP